MLAFNNVALPPSMGVRLSEFAFKLSKKPQISLFQVACPKALPASPKKTWAKLENKLRKLESKCTNLESTFYGKTLKEQRFEARSPIVVHLRLPQVTAVASRAQQREQQFQELLAQLQSADDASALEVVGSSLDALRLQRRTLHRELHEVQLPADEDPDQRLACIGARRVDLASESDWPGKGDVVVVAEDGMWWGDQGEVVEVVVRDDGPAAAASVDDMMAQLDDTPRRLPVFGASSARSVTFRVKVSEQDVLELPPSAVAVWGLDAGAAPTAASRGAGVGAAFALLEAERRRGTALQATRGAANARGQGKATTAIANARSSRERKARKKGKGGKRK